MKLGGLYFNFNKMNSTFGEVFMFLTNLAWKSRLTIPVLVTTAFLIMDIRLQIEINIQAGQAAAAELDPLADNSDDDDDNTNGDVDYEEYTTDSQDDDENGNVNESMFLDQNDTGSEFDYDENPANQIRISLGLT